MDNVHEGHRERLKQRFLEHGLDSFSDVEAIELLLFFALPRRNTNELAHALISRFGSFKGVMEAGIDELTEVAGVGKNAAVIDGSEAAGNYLLPLFSYLTDERVYVLCLDSRSQVICCRDIAEGMVNRVDFAIRDIVDAALKNNAARVILAHNHLSGTALPSNTDLATTVKIKSALSLIGVELADHIVVCENDFVSMRDSGYFLNF